MAKNKIIDFQNQKEKNNNILLAFNTVPELKEYYNNLTFTVAVETRKDHVDFRRNAIMSSVKERDGDKDNGHLMYLSLPDTNQYDLEEAFLLLKSLKNTLSYQYDKVNGKGSFNKKFSEFEREGIYGNFHNNPEAVSFKLFDESMSYLTIPTSKSEEKNRSDLYNVELKESASLFYYSNQYNEMHKRTFIDKDLSQGDFAKYLADENSKIIEYGKKKELKTSGGLTGADALKDLLKKGSLSKGILDNEFVTENNSLTADEVLEKLKGYYDKDIKSFDKYTTLMEQKFKDQLNLLPEDYSSSINKIKELNRLKSVIDHYLKNQINFVVFSEEHANKPENNVSESTMKKIADHKQFLYDLSEPLGKTHQNALDSILNGTPYVDIKQANKDQMEEDLKNSISEKISDDVPDFIRKALENTLGKVVNDKNKVCGCVICYYESKVNELVTI